MAIPIIVKIDPRDLKPNTALGVGLPFNKSSVFRSTYSTQEQAKYKLINLLLTNKGERVFNPNFGSSVRRKLFDPSTSMDDVKNDILEDVSNYVPEVAIIDIKIKNDEDYNLSTIKVSYKMKISGNTDNIIIKFE